jgi:hypothetical protein
MLDIKKEVPFGPIMCSRTLVELKLVRIGKSTTKGVGAGMGFQLSSFMVWMINGWDYWLYGPLEACGVGTSGPRRHEDPFFIFIFWLITITYLLILYTVLRNEYIESKTVVINRLNEFSLS